MRRFVPVLLLSLLTALPPRGAAQESSAATLVVVVAGDARYHQPACPLVAKAGASVTVTKLSEAKTKGLAAHDCDEAAIEQPKREANAVGVHVQPGDKRYHKAGCSKLTPSATKITLGDAGKKYWPCPVCKPPIRQREKDPERQAQARSL